MATRLEVLQELDRRGKVPAEWKPYYDEAVKRGLVKGAEPADDGLRMSGAGSFLTSVAEGVPIAGPAILGGLQRAGAYGRSLQSGKPFDEELATVRDMTGQAQEEHPYLSTAGHVTGAVAGLAPVAATGGGAMMLGLRGPTIIGRSLTAAGTGAAIGGADSAVRSGGDLTETAKGAAFGAAAGAAGPAIGNLIGAGVRKVTDALTRPSGPLSAISRRAAGYAANAAPSAEQTAALQRLGPEATLADVSPEWMGVARGAAARPGSRDAIVNMLAARSAGANQRLGADLDTSLGAVRNPGQTEDYLSTSREALGPQYAQAFQGARAVDTQGIADHLDALAVDLRGPAQQAVQRVRGYLNIPGQNALDPSPRALFETRQAIDGLLAGEQNPKVIRELSMARRQIDAEIAQAVPGVKDVDAQFSELSRQSEALQRGGQVLDSGKTAVRPEDLARELQQGALPQGTQVGPSAAPVRMREGARAEIDRVAGLNSNDPAALQRMVKGEGDWNRDKLRILFGPRADDALNAIDRETTFYRTHNRVSSGSDTAMGTGFREFLDQAATPAKIPHDLTITGALLRAVQKVAGGNAAQKAERFSGELGRASVATGADRDALLAAIQDYARRRAAGQPVSDGVARIAQQLLYGSQEPLRIHLSAGERARVLGQ